MRTREKEKSLPVLEKELDLIFGEYIKLRDTVNGVINCFICGKPVKRNEAEVMHYIDRRHLATRWHTKNCHSGDVDCNKFDEMHKIKYEQKMIELYGIEYVRYLENLGRSLMKPMRHEIEDMITIYKSKTSELKKV